ncbi:hypothetical protein JXA84_02105 [candidate division WOR-3 bacterium]|nr:hypothetical protein [candidate division WOR-3 bacterium]
MVILEFFTLIFISLAKISVPFFENSALTYILFIPVAVALAISFLKTKKLCWLRIIMLAYFLAVAIKLFVSPPCDSQNSFITSEFSECRSYASRICLSCIGIE